MLPPVASAHQPTSVLSLQSVKTSEAWQKCAHCVCMLTLVSLCAFKSCRHQSGGKAGEITNPYGNISLQLGPVTPLTAHCCRKYFSSRSNMTWDSEDSTSSHMASLETSLIPQYDVLNFKKRKKREELQWDISEVLKHYIKEDRGYTLHTSKLEKCILR